MRRVNPGDPLQIRAADWNRLQQAATFVESGGWLQGNAQRGAARVLIKNSSGSDVDRFGILNINGVVIDETENLAEFQSNWCIDGGFPVVKPSGAFAVTQEPIADGDIGWCIINGPTVCQVNIANSNHRFARMQSSTTELLSCQSGPARIHYQPSGSGVKWCIISIGQMEAALRLARGTITARSGTTPGSGTVTIQELSSGLISATTDTVTAYSMSQTATATNTYVHIAWCNISDAWWLIAEDCP